MKRIKGLGLGLGLVWSNKQIKNMLVGVIKVIAPLIIISAVLRGAKRPRFIPFITVR